MPDDFFNQQQNQRRPRYAAGSDIDSIYTGREIPEGGFRRGSGNSFLGAIIILCAVATVGAIALLISAMNEQSNGAANDSTMQADAQGVLHESVTGEVNHDMPSAFYSEDRSKLSVEAYLINGTNKTICNVVVTFTVIDDAENVLAEKIVDTPSELVSGETGNYTTIIETPSKPTGHTQVRMHSSYDVRME